MKILLTGASGFLGSALALNLLDAGHDVALLLRPHSSVQRLRNKERQCRIMRAASDDDVTGFVAAIAPDAVIHTACSYGRRGETTLELFDANVRLGLLLLHALQKAAVPRRVCFVNTGSALAPEVSLYALSKHQFAQWGRSLSTQTPERLQFVNVQLQHMYGAGDDRSKFSTHVLHACHANQPVLELTAGEQERDFIYIADVVGAYQTLLAQAGGLAPFENIEVGSGQAPTLRSFVQTVHELTQSMTRLDFGALPYRPNEAMHCRADISRMRTLGWQPAFDLRAGLAQTIEQEFRS